VQGYLSRGENIVVRVRRDVDAQGFARGFITIKGKTEGIARDEYEYEVPEQEAAALLRLCEGFLVEKERYVCDAGKGLVWEIDVFKGDNEGLIVAEIELPDEATDFERPVWLGKEVSMDKRYFNAALAVKPYKLW
jgi:adenylate cyclase